MFGFDEARDYRDQVYNYDGDDHQAKFSHEAIAGAAGFEAMRQWEDHQRREGETVDHPLAKEVLVGFAGAEVDRLAETKGMDWLDRERAKRQAQDQACQMYDQQYGGYDNYDPNQYAMHDSMQGYGGGY